LIIQHLELIYFGFQFNIACSRSSPAPEGISSQFRRSREIRGPTAAFLASESSNKPRDTTCMVSLMAPDVSDLHKVRSNRLHEQKLPLNKPG
jgi:hypothetical protein